jgi:hypothetical protein
MRNSNFPGQVASAPRIENCNRTLNRNRSESDLAVNYASAIEPVAQQSIDGRYRVRSKIEPV